MAKELKPIQCICGHRQVEVEYTCVHDIDFPRLRSGFVMETVSCPVCNTTLSSYEGVKMWNVLMTQLRRNKKRQGE